MARKSFPLNASLIPGQMYFVIWEHKHSRVIMFKKPKRFEREATLVTDVYATVGSNELVMYIETVQTDVGYWYKLVKGDQMGYVAADMIDLSPVTGCDIS